MPLKKFRPALPMLVCLLFVTQAARAAAPGETETPLFKEARFGTLREEAYKAAKLATVERSGPYRLFAKAKNADFAGEKWDALYHFAYDRLIRLSLSSDERADEKFIAASCALEANGFTLVGLRGREGSLDLAPLLAEQAGHGKPDRAARAAEEFSRKAMEDKYCLYIYDENAERHGYDSSKAPASRRVEVLINGNELSVTFTLPQKEKALLGELKANPPQLYKEKF